MLRLILSLFGTLIDLVTALAPVPPAMTGRPTPSLVCSFALRVLVTGGAGGGVGGVGVISDSEAAGASASLLESGSGAAADPSSSRPSSCASSSCSSPSVSDS